jgi:L-ribulokinase
MSIVTGVDFGTLSVRVTPVATNQGKLGSGFAEYPLHRRNEDPDYYTTQSHDGHMRPFSEAIERALGAAKVPGNQVAALAIDTAGSNVIPVDEKLEPLGEYTSLRRIASATRGNP